MPLLPPPSVPRRGWEVAAQHAKGYTTTLWQAPQSAFPHQRLILTLSGGFGQWLRSIWWSAAVDQPQPAGRRLGCGVASQPRLDRLLVPAPRRQVSVFVQVMLGALLVVTGHEAPTAHHRGGSAAAPSLLAEAARTGAPSARSATWSSRLCSPIVSARSRWRSSATRWDHDRELHRDLLPRPARGGDQLGVLISSSPQPNPR